MNTLYWTIVISSSLELVLLGLVLVFFVKLRKSEILLSQLERKQQAFVERLDFNSKLEKELVASFATRQQELIKLESKLDERARELYRLLRQTETFCKSPQFLRQTILSGYKRGQSVQDLSVATGMSKDEIELILRQENL